MAPLGVGLLGLSADGSWASEAHLPYLLKSDHYSIRALQNSSKQSAERAKEKYALSSTVATYGDIQSLLTDPHVDVVAVVVKAPEHYNLVKPALRAGKDVFVEWPLGANLAQAEELATLAESLGSRAVVGLQGRQDPSVSKAREMVRNGLLGDVLHTTMVGAGVFFGAEAPHNFEYSCDIDNGANLVTIGAAHSLDTLCYVLGEFKELHATLTNSRPRMPILDRSGKVCKVIDKTAHDHLAVTGVLESGTLATVVYYGGNSRTGGKPFSWEINGTKGSLVLEIVEGTAGIPQLFHPILRFVSSDQDAEMKEIEVEGPTTVDFSYNVGRVWDAFAGQNDGSAPTFADALLRHRMVEAIYQSDATKRRESYL